MSSRKPRLPLSEVGCPEVQEGGGDQEALVVRELGPPSSPGGFLAPCSLWPALCLDQGGQKGSVGQSGSDMAAVMAVMRRR